jgi:RNA-binding protein
VDELNNVQLRKLKAMAQRMEASIKVGKHGLSEPFIKSLDEELSRHELVKVKFAEFKEQKKELAPKLAERTNSRLVMQVGNIVVLFRRNPDEAKQKVKF